jgi:hypothetical protein
VPRYVSFSAIAAHRSDYDPAEAIGLVLAALRAAEHAAGNHGAITLPDARHILLDRHGRVWLSLHSREAATVDVVKRVGQLLCQLLDVDNCSTNASAGVPGALLLLIARAAGQIDLPAPQYLELRNALNRFAPSERQNLSSLHARIVHSQTHDRYRTGAADSRLWPVVRRHRILARATWGASLAAVVVALVFVTIGRRAPEPHRVARHEAVRVEVLDQPVTVEAPAIVGLPDSTVVHPPVESAASRPLLRLAGLADAFSPSFATGGRVLLFHAGRSRAALMRATFNDGGSTTISTLLHDGAANYHATLSPDGAWLAYDSDRDGVRGVFVADSDAQDPRKVSGDGYAAVPKWSPDGGRLAFVKAEPARPRVWNVWVADIRSGIAVRISRHRVGQAWGASWFPDGKRIAYSVEDRLVVANLEDGSTRVFASPRRGHLVRTPAVSPEGRLIVFQTHKDGVWLLDLTSGETRRVLSDRSAEEFAWSPDGQSIVFHTKRDGTWSVWQMDLHRALAG